MEDRKHNNKESNNAINKVYFLNILGTQVIDIWYFR